jgi:hypothetical protein
VVTGISSFPHFFKTPYVNADFIELDFLMGCPNTENRRDKNTNEQLNKLFTVSYSLFTEHYFLFTLTPVNNAQLPVNREQITTNSSSQDLLLSHFVRFTLAA